MKASNILKTLFTSFVQEFILGAHSSKSAVQSVYLVQKILDQIRRVRVGAKQAKGCKTFGN